jgi:hypothetical protein
MTSNFDAAPSYLLGPGTKEVGGTVAPTSAQESSGRGWDITDAKTQKVFAPQGFCSVWTSGSAVRSHSRVP